MTEKTQKFWSFTCINWDLLRDDLDSVVDIFPRTFYSTREKAVKALADQLNSGFEDDEEYEKLDISNMKWKKNELLSTEDFYHELYDETYFLYEMDLVD